MPVCRVRRIFFIFTLKGRNCFFVGKLKITVAHTYRFGSCTKFKHSLHRIYGIKDGRVISRCILNRRVIGRRVSTARC